MIVGYDSRTMDGELDFKEAAMQLFGCSIAYPNIAHAMDGGVSFSVYSHNYETGKLVHEGTVRLYSNGWELTKPGV